VHYGQCILPGSFNKLKNQLKKKGGRMYPLFLDFRAAFDKIDREEMFECMREWNGWYGTLRRYT
jgi:hypothetical protein